jgi:hypothetical protein
MARWLGWASRSEAGRGLKKRLKEARKEKGRQTRSRFAGFRERLLEGLYTECTSVIYSRLSNLQVVGVLGVTEGKKRKNRNIRIPKATGK